MTTTTLQVDSKPSSLTWNFAFTALLFYIAIAGLLFGDILLFGDSKTIIGQPGLDSTTYFVPLGEFITREFHAGRIPLWNPYIFCGTPFLANFNSEMLYPFKWLHLIADVAPALNWGIAIHVVLEGWFMAMWVRWRGIGATGAFAAGVIFAYSGATYMHILAGHSPMIHSFAFIPLIFFAIDGCFKKQTWKFCLIGIFAVGMQILTGVTQIVYQTGLVAVLYSVLLMLSALWVQYKSKGLPVSWKTWVNQYAIVSLKTVLIYVGGVALGAAQLLPGIETSRETVRANGITYEFASNASLPTENLLTAIAPRLMGDRVAFKPGTTLLEPWILDANKQWPAPEYYGRSNLWEVCTYVGSATVVLALLGVCWGFRCKQGWIFLILALYAVLLALGSNVPLLHKLLFNYLPGFSSFRASARFTACGTACIALLAGIGMDFLLQMSGNYKRRLMIGASVALAFGAMVGLSGWMLETSGTSSSLWKSRLREISQDPDHTIPEIRYSTDDMIKSTSAFAGKELFRASFAPLGMAMLLGLGLMWKPARHGIVLITVIELGLFAAYFRHNGPARFPDYPVDSQLFIENMPFGQRILTPSLFTSSMAIGMGYGEIYGYDPVILKRYAELLGYTQIRAFPDLKLDTLNFIPPMVDFRPHMIPILQMLRCGAVFQQQMGMLNGKFQVVNRIYTVYGPMPRLILTSKYRVEPTREGVLSGMLTESFDASGVVFLEQEPAIKPVIAYKSGTAEVIAETSDSIEIKADVTTPAVLVVTDVYSKFWRVRSLETGPQNSYDVMPANWALRGIPLAAGKHHFVLEYVPPMFTVGAYISVISWVAWFGLFFIPTLISWIRKIQADRKRRAAFLAEEGLI